MTTTPCWRPWLKRPASRWRSSTADQQLYRPPAACNGSGDLPDIIYTWEFDQNYEKWANDGLILPLDEYIEDYPNLMANISEGQWGKARVGGADGQIYAVPRPTGSAWGVISNDEWLEKLGVDMPTTPEEAYEYGKLVATGPGWKRQERYVPVFPVRPVGGLLDDLPLPAVLPAARRVLPARPRRRIQDQGKNGRLHAYLDFMHKMYAEGIIDPEFFTNKYYDDQTKFKQGRVALLHGGITNIPEFAAKDVPNAAEIYSFHPALRAKNDEKPRNEAAAATRGGWMINADVDPKAAAYPVLPGLGQQRRGLCHHRRRRAGHRL
ncbi:MAG: extracellular solute-binding protein [Ruthenibacterium lactatiformans]